MDSVSLAEPRRRQKWTLNPRGNLWANDESKFGQKLMEKMGWQKGKGLGANEDGRVQHVSAKLKGNNKGIGFEGHDDTWLAHQNDFQSVLAALNIEHGDAGKEMSESEKKANLEELSKKSKRRVHYQKFVRGKDTNNYSVEDLGCILGTKSEKVKSSKTPGSPKQEDKGDVDSDAEVKEDKKFVQGGNYADYFAKKMAEMKAKGKLSSVPTSWTATTTSSNSEDDEDVQRIGFSGTSTATESQNTEESITVDKETNKKKKSKKRKKDVEDNVIIEEQQNNILEQSLENGKTKKKKKDKKQDRDIEIHEEREMEVAAVSKKKKSKKSNKELAEVEQKSETLDASHHNLNEKKKSKKNKKSKDKELNVDIDNSSAQDHSSVVEEDIKKKKSKKSKKEKVAEVVTAVDEDSGLEQDDTKYKKQKKVKKEKTKEKKTTYSDEEKENRKKRKSESSSDEVSSPAKKMKTTDDSEHDEDTKFAGFKGSNLLSIPGYGSIES